MLIELALVLALYYGEIYVTVMSAEWSPDP